MEVVQRSLENVPTPLIGATGRSSKTWYGSTGASTWSPSNVVLPRQCSTTVAVTFLMESLTVPNNRVGVMGGQDGQDGRVGGGGDYL